MSRRMSKRVPTQSSIVRNKDTPSFFITSDKSLSVKILFFWNCTLFFLLFLLEASDFRLVLSWAASLEMPLTLRPNYGGLPPLFVSDFV